MQQFAVACVPAVELQGVCMDVCVFVSVAQIVHVSLVVDVLK
jgi:hypothetical protein